MHEILHVILHALEETAKLLPFLFLTYLLLEFIEHKAAKTTAALTARAGWLGPAVGGLLGAVPQCGFSASASNLYAGGVISMGTLVAVFLSTSDEMLPVMLSEKAAPARILAILGIKVACGILAGFAVDLVFRLMKRSARQETVHELCEDENCGCGERGIVISSLIHTLQIAFFIFLFSLAVGGLVEWIGEDRLAALAAKAGVFSTLICGLIGLIPNCASSVVLTELFLDGVISTGSILAGLLAGSGVGLLILFRINKNIRQNLTVTAVIYGVGVGVGILFDLLGLTL
ncbi:MAG: arsenic efflux protein [Clostridia bacterium]|nr:arsenic efflux protein [Clostridia bacterium]